MIGERGSCNGVNGLSSSASCVSHSLNALRSRVNFCDLFFSDKLSANLSAEKRHFDRFSCYWHILRCNKSSKKIEMIVKMNISYPEYSKLQITFVLHFLKHMNDPLAGCSSDDCFRNKLNVVYSNLRIQMASCYRKNQRIVKHQVSVLANSAQRKVKQTTIMFPCYP